MTAEVIKELPLYTLYAGDLPGGIEIDFGRSSFKRGYFVMNNLTRIVEYVAVQFPDGMMALHMLEKAVNAAPWIEEETPIPGEVAPNGDIFH